MLHKELQELQSYIEQLDLCLNSIYHTLHEIMSHPAKNYTVSFKKYKFDFTHPFDKHDKIQVEKAKRRYLRMILQDVLTQRIKKLPGSYKTELYEILYIFGYGQNPDDHKVAKADLKKLKEEVSSKDNDFGKQRPLDYDAYQVKMQDQRKIKFEQEDDHV